MRNVYRQGASPKLYHAHLTWSYFEQFQFLSVDSTGIIKKHRHTADGKTVCISCQ